MKKLITLLCLIMAYTQATAQVTITRIPTYYLGGSINSLTGFNGKLFFIAAETTGVIKTTNLQYIDHDNLPATISQSHNIIPTTLFKLNISPFATVGNKLFFTGSNPNNYFNFYSYDDAGAPVPVTGIDTNVLPRIESMSVINNKIYLAMDSYPVGTEPWEYDPATNTSKLLKDIRPGYLSSTEGGFCEFNGKIYFPANDDVHGLELAEYDPGTGNVTIIDIYPGVLGSSVSNLITYNNKLYFFANNGATGIELYVYDGVNPPSAAKELFAGSTCPIQSTIPFTKAIGILNGKLHYEINDGASTVGVCAYDPATNQNTIINMTVATGVFGFSHMTLYGGKLYFIGANGLNTTRDVYSYDGVNQPVKITSPMFTATNQVPMLARYFNSLYFVAGFIDNNSRYLYKLTDPNAAEIKQDEYNLLNVTVYPNPAAENITININLNATKQLNVSITNVLGSKVFTTNTQTYTSGYNDISIVTNTYPAGTYFYSICDDKGEPLTKGQFIKQ